MDVQVLILEDTLAFDQVLCGCWAVLRVPGCPVTRLFQPVSKSAALANSNRCSDGPALQAPLLPPLATRPLASLAAGLQNSPPGGGPSSSELRKQLEEALQRNGLLQGGMHRLSALACGEVERRAAAEAEAERLGAEVLDLQEQLAAPFAGLVQREAQLAAREAEVDGLRDAWFRKHAQLADMQAQVQELLHVVRNKQAELSGDLNGCRDRCCWLLVHMNAWAGLTAACSVHK